MTEEKNLVMLEKLFATGVNFNNADVKIRSEFHLNAEQKEKYLSEYVGKKFQDIVLLVTCNRTEIYGVGDAGEAGKILCEITHTDKKIFSQCKFVKKGQEALQYIFDVTAGLESQILGDYEILGQFKTACKVSKNANLLSSFFERLANTAIQSSKEIKTKTEMSKGTVSVSYAAIEVLKEKFENENAKILLIGAGKFGQKVAKNLKNYLPNSNISIANRTGEKAKRIAEENGFKLIPFEMINKCANDFDAIVISTTPDEYLLHPSSFNQNSTRLILDLSVPRAVNPLVKAECGIELLNIDDLSKNLDATLENRKTYLPAAKQIIDKSISEFLEWNKVFEHRDKIRKVKEQLLRMSSECPHLQKLSPEESKRQMNKAMNQLISELKTKPTHEIDLNDTVDYFMMMAHSAVMQQ